MRQKGGKWIAQSQAELASVLGVCPDTVKRWASQGMPGRPREYPIAEIVTWLREAGPWRPADGCDPLLVGGERSDALERYRDERAKLARLDRLERERQLIPRDEIHGLLAEVAGLLRAAGDRLQKQFGRDAQDVLDNALDDVDRLVDRLCDDDGGHA
jgi:phage terminase Nu1 subunit (DNA packaging protein)